MTIIARMPRRDGLAETGRLERRINRLFTDALGTFDWQDRDSAAAAWVPAVDILEDPTAIRIIAEVPGIAPNEVKISLANTLLTLQGTKQQVAEERTEKAHHYERTYGAFERRFTLPATVDPSAITAKYAYGVLTVTLPKVEKARPRQIEVEVTTEK